MFLPYQPAPEVVRSWQMERTDCPYSYPETGMIHGEPPQGYFVNQRRIRLGYGEQVFATACEAFRRWRMFPSWLATVGYPDSPIEEGQVLAVIARFGFLRWVNFCRILSLVEETGPVRKWGFVYGTLREHALKGEERFQIEMYPDGAVWYDLLAYARPHHVLSWVGYPLARVLQKKFAASSIRSMMLATTELDISKTFLSGVG